MSELHCAFLFTCYDSTRVFYVIINKLLDVRFKLNVDAKQDQTKQGFYFITLSRPIPGKYDIRKKKIPHVEYVHDCYPGNYIEQSSSNPHGVLIHVHFNLETLLSPSCHQFPWIPWMNRRSQTVSGAAWRFSIDPRESVEVGIKFKYFTSIGDYKWFIFVEVFIRRIITAGIVLSPKRSLICAVLERS